VVVHSGSNLPGNWFAPPGSNQSSSGGNETAEASGEIRNKHWLDRTSADVLREYGVALTLIDQGWVPRPWEIKKPFDMRTSDFLYVRLLGDGKE
jgi:hypothetical protein